MKKLIILFILIGSISVSAQDYKKFKVGLGLGYAIGSGNGSSGGVLVTIEPAYRLSDDFSLGLRLETAALTRGYSETIPTGISLDVAAIGSYTLNGQYYFGQGKFRPFGGLGLGLYTLAAVNYTGSSSGTGADATSKFGFYPRLGFDLGHFNMALDYNIIPSTPNTSGGTGEFNNSYIGIRIGAFFGGGKN